MFHAHLRGPSTRAFAFAQDDKVCFSYRVLRLGPIGSPSARSGQAALAQDDNCELRPDKSRVEAAGLGGVAGAFDDGAAVGEQSQFIGIAPELEHEFVVADAAVGIELAAHLAEIHRAM